MKSPRRSSDCRIAGLQDAGGLRPRPFRIETSAKARHRHAELLHQLADTPDTYTTALRHRLEGCAKGARCASAACPICLRRFRRRLMKAGARHLEGRTVLRLSWVPPRSLIAPDALDDFDLRRFHQSALRALQRKLPSDAVMVGGIDISLNVEENVPAGWQVHVYGLVGVGVGTAPSPILETLRELPVGDCPRPLKLKVVERPDLRRLLSYVFKARFYRRSRYRYIRTKTGAPAWNTRAQRLAAADELQIAMMTDRFPIGQRLLLIGLRRVGSPLDFDLRPTGGLSSPLGSP